MSTIAAIILAAGSSSRMGTSKQLLEWKSGNLLSHTINIVKNSRANRILVVLGANEDAHRRAIANEDVTIVSNSDWSKGMGSSIKAGIRQIEKDDSVDGALLLVCDQPFLTGAHIDKMIDTFTAKGSLVVASQYGGTKGVPVLFAKALFAALLSIADHEGAKKLIKEDHTASIPFPKGTIDVDTPADYARARSDDAPQR